jgi:hypothetical protein
MDLPEPWHPVVLRLTYVFFFLAAFATAATMGLALRGRHPDHAPFYVTLVADAVVVIFTLYCANAADSQGRSIRKSTMRACANPKCSRQVFFSVSSQKWLHWGGGLSETCVKRLDTTAAPSNSQDYSFTNHQPTDLATSLGQMRRGEGTKVRSKDDPAVT